MSARPILPQSTAKKSASVRRKPGQALVKSSQPSSTAAKSVSATKSGAHATPSPRPSSRPADDPLAAERTRWLTTAVGGGKALAKMLGVSPSQTSRWANGKERPGAIAAPLLIDLEHVLARVRLVWSEPAATTWMVSANAHLAGARPVDVLRARGVGPVLEALDAAMWGNAA